MLSLIFIFLFFLISSTQCQNKTIVLPPSNTSTFDVALIYIQGSQIPSANYVKGLLMLQQKFPDNLWIAIPEFLYDLPDSNTMYQIMNQSYEALREAGCKMKSEMPFFFAAHSLGGKALQDYLFVNDTYKHLPVNLTGLMLPGSFFNRHYRMKVGKNFVPVLTMGGQLDGYNRITRVAESLYYDYLLRSTPDNSYTVIFDRMNHYQFVGDGTPPDYLEFNDITPEIDDYQAMDIVTSYMRAFLKIALCAQYTDCFDEKIFIAYGVTYSLDLVRPILDAFKLEGYYYYEKPPCFSLITPENCLLGSPWIGTVQQMLGTLDTIPNITNTDTFKPFNDVFIERPKLHNNCTQGMPTCVLNISTFTQTNYFIEYDPDAEDESFNIIAPIELRAEMISRQAIVYAMTGKKLDFNKTDGGSMCAYLNDLTIDWALTQCSADTLKRYSTKGIPLITGADIDSFDSQLAWMWNPMQYVRDMDPHTNKTVYLIQAPMLKASLDSPIEWLRGFHYCKLLSPSRALEWIYVDSLKPYPYF